MSAMVAKAVKMDLKISFWISFDLRPTNLIFIVLGGGAGGMRSQVSKAALDKQLDDYMSKGSA